MLAKKCLTGSSVMNGAKLLEGKMGIRSLKSFSGKHLVSSPSQTIKSKFGSVRTNLIYTSLKAYSSSPYYLKKDFSTAPNPVVAEDVEKTLRNEVDVVRKIKAEILEADVNNDGKIDSEELKAALRKVGGFTDREILEIGDIFYSARAGASVNHEDFLKGVAQILRQNDGISDTSDSVDDVEKSNATPHRKLSSSSQHPLGLGNCSTEYMFGKDRGVYTPEELDIKITHVPPVTNTDKAAHFAVKIVRFLFDAVSGWNFGEVTKAKIMRRVIFLETVAAIPGFVAAMVRHFKSLRNMSRDGGMLNMFLDEANNERMHLLTFVKMRDPGKIFRVLVMASQTLVGTGFFILYHISPKFCHRFVGYVEEEACHTYTKIIDEVENAPEGSELAAWRTEIAPAIGRAYWRLGEKGTVLDVIYAIRADEAEHRDVNHVCCGMSEGQINPLMNPQEKFDKMLLKYVKQMLERDNK